MRYRSLKAFFAAAFLAVLPLCASAADGPAEYALTKQYGTVLFRVLHQDYLNMVGRFNDYSGTLQFDPADLAKTQLTATVQMTSLNMAEADVSETLVNSSVWFNATVYPSATFTSTSATVIGENEVDLNGDLAFMGITKPWTLHVKFFGGSDGSLDGSTVGILGTGSFNRLDFGLKEYLNMAAENVEIEVNVKFNRK